MAVFPTSGVEKAVMMPYSGIPATKMTLIHAICSYQFAHVKAWFPICAFLRVELGLNRDVEAVDGAIF